MAWVAGHTHGADLRVKTQHTWHAAAVLDFPTRDPSQALRLWALGVTAPARQCRDSLAHISPSNGVPTSTGVSVATSDPKSSQGVADLPECGTDVKRSQHADPFCEASQRREVGDVVDTIHGVLEGVLLASFVPVEFPYRLVAAQ
eukprot:CAMPEP_0181172000 /NCGR_PEP_ID=MMETSP1096-20121128/2219_1 /TAXON_ID=156174 ORGANISM="Chrysochromulina ericina, Strain CCMP281" /NCGR_SAMPLE_ID=MMETSP1096 /ASSEMBLY_ACC=CAM_ASM_000453 /LENGTH=144 /DNA_ID=CAMNT_0023259705 /DNA_START=223 /DNA_END=659 /DNA_ORIENTATION=+